MIESTGEKLTIEERAQVALVVIRHSLRRHQRHLEALAGDVGSVAVVVAHALGRQAAVLEKLADRLGDQERERLRLDSTHAGRGGIRTPSWPSERTGGPPTHPVS